MRCKRRRRCSTENITSQVVKTPKVFWMDCGLLRSLTGRLPDAPMDGHFFETYVASELIKLMRTLETDAELFYYRTRSGLEVDFLIQTPRGLLAIEVKARDAVGRTDIAGMKRLADKLGERWLGGLVVYKGDRLEEIAPGYWAVPSYRLLG
jgi:predicted AAA+ superfamily ATPase